MASGVVSKFGTPFQPLAKSRVFPRSCNKTQNRMVQKYRLLYFDIRWYQYVYQVIHTSWSPAMCLKACLKHCRSNIILLIIYFTCFVPVIFQINVWWTPTQKVDDFESTFFKFIPVACCEVLGHLCQHRACSGSRSSSRDRGSCAGFVSLEKNCGMLWDFTGIWMDVNRLWWLY